MIFDELNFHRVTEKKEYQVLETMSLWATNRLLRTLQQQLFLDSSLSQRLRRSQQRTFSITIVHASGHHHNTHLLDLRAGTRPSPNLRSGDHQGQRTNCPQAWWRTCQTSLAIWATWVSLDTTIEGRKTFPLHSYPGRLTTAWLEKQTVVVEVSGWRVKVTEVTWVVTITLITITNLKRNSHHFGG